LTLSQCSSRLGQLLIVLATEQDNIQ